MAAAPAGADHGGMTTSEVPATALRVTQAERDQVVDLLKDAYADGRLDHDEFELRVHLAMTAKTRGELAVLPADLKPMPAATTGGGRRTDAAIVASDGNDRMLAALAHGSGYLFSFVGPLLFLLLGTRNREFVRRHAAAALNFQLTVLLVVIVTFGVGAVLYAVTWILAGIGALAALAGRPFHYPWTLRLLR